MDKKNTDTITIPSEKVAEILMAIEEHDAALQTLVEHYESLAEQLRKAKVLQHDDTNAKATIEEMRYSLREMANGFRSFL